MSAYISPWASVESIKKRTEETWKMTSCDFLYSFTYQWKARHSFEYLLFYYTIAYFAISLTLFAFLSVYICFKKKPGAKGPRRHFLNLKKTDASSFFLKTMCYCSFSSIAYQNKLQKKCSISSLAHQWKCAVSLSVQTADSDVLILKAPIHCRGSIGEQVM